jgi:regulatory protein
VKITRLYKQKRDRSGVNVEIDGEYLFSIRHQNTILESNIFIGKELDSVDIQKILLQDFQNKNVEDAIIKISRRPHSIFEIEQYLKEKFRIFSQKYQEILTDSTFDQKEVILQIINYLISKKYLDDETFAKAWVEARYMAKKYGLEYIKNELIQKKIDKSIIEKFLNTGNADRDYKNAYKLAEKKLIFITEKDPNKKVMKIRTFLLRRGFSTKTTYDVTKNLL